MSDTTRRDFHRTTLCSLVTFSLLETLFQHQLFADEIQPLAARWLAELNSMSADVKGQKISQLQWQEQVEKLMTKVELAELLKFIDFEKLSQSVQYKDQGERSLTAKLPKVEGLPTQLVFGHQVFALKKGRSVVPHGHDNMATAFLILKGDFQGRHYDRLEDDKEHMIIRPTIDRSFTVGDYSTVSDHRDNVHWFQATSDEAFIFNIHVMNVREGRSGRIYVDPNGEKLTGERIRAKKISAVDAYKIYG